MSSSIESLIGREYEHGFVTDIESDTFPPGLNEDVVRAISAKKSEPEFMLEWRLKTYAKLGIPLQEQKLLAGVAVDAIFDSVSVGTTMRDELAKHGVIFCSL